MKPLDQALQILRRGGTVVFPTETLYGLGAIATDKAAVEKVYRIKRRPKEKVLPVIVGGFKQAERYFALTTTDRRLAKKFWPGPLSLILKVRSKKMAAALGSKFVAVRHPANPLAANLARRSGSPIVSTSANISGKPGCFSVAAVKKQFAGGHGDGRVGARRRNIAQPDLYLNGGRLKRSLPSTIVRVKRNALLVVREGAIPRASIHI